MLVREGDILRFAERARSGEAMVYARGERPPTDLVRSMRPLIEAGVLVPVTAGKPGDRQFIIQRGRGAFPVAGRGSKRRGLPKQTIARSSLVMVLNCLIHAARHGKPCPTNEELAEACRLSGKLAASYRMRKLAAMGKIAVVDHSPFYRRVVTILTGPHAGKSTREAAI